MSITVVNTEEATRSIKIEPFPKVMKHTNTGALYKFETADTIGTLIDAVGGDRNYNIGNSLNGFEEFYGDITISQKQELA